MKKIITALFLITSLNSVFAQQSAEVQATLGIIKKNLGQSAANLKTYSWLETTTVFVDGEQKSSSMNQCYYSVDGKLNKVATANASGTKAPGGLRGKAAANKKAEIEAYLKQGAALIQTYLPPVSDKLQKIYAAGTVAINVLKPNVQYKLDFPNYNLAGDKMSVSVDKVKGLLMGVAVNSYIEKPEDAVVFTLSYNTLPDGTQFPAETVLTAAAKKVKIVIVNSGYKK